MEKKGEAGLGSFNVLNGEMVLLANIGFDKQF
jgi:alpha-acetolactate decarboxylase